MWYDPHRTWQKCTMEQIPISTLPAPSSPSLSSDHQSSHHTQHHPRANIDPSPCATASSTPSPLSLRYGSCTVTTPQTKTNSSRHHHQRPHHHHIHFPPPPSYSPPSPSMMAGAGTAEAAVMTVKDATVTSTDERLSDLNVEFDNEKVQEAEDGPEAYEVAGGPSASSGTHANKMSSSSSTSSAENHHLPLVSDDSIPGPSNIQQLHPHKQSPLSTSLEGSSSIPWEHPMPNDYSYAYYVPGPPTRHTNVPNKYPGTLSSAGSTTSSQMYREGSYRTRHTYLTRYGTEENIYEEISEVERARLRPGQQQSLQAGLHPDEQQHRESMMSINQSLVEEEVRRVQCGHRRVLGELNLAVEAMLMPSSSREGSPETDRDGETEDQLADLLTIGPTDELLSPVPLVLDLDSGFSGSSSGASYRSAGGSLRRGLAQVERRPRLSVNHHVRPRSSNFSSAAPSEVTFQQQLPQQSNNKSFWGKKAWKKITGFPSTISLNKSKDESRMRSGPPWDESSSVCEHRLVQQQPPPTTITTGAAASHHHLHHGSRRTTLQHTISQRSSEDSWCSCSASENELSSDDESDRSATSSNRSNGQLRNTLNKAKTLCDKLRGSGGVGSNHRLSSPSVAVAANLSSSLSNKSDSTTNNSPLNHTSGCTTNSSNQGRLSRWFSIRRGSAQQYDIENFDGTRSPQGSNKMPLLPEVEEETIFASCISSQQRRQIPPSLPPAPPNLTSQQLKRRMIVSAIVHSENSYVATLQRLVNDYKKPLEESSPAILSNSKISTLFLRLPEILQCHTLFRIALAESVRNWDRDEKIGDVFVASFSKAVVLDIYSGFINNFSMSMDLAKMEAKRKTALADFLKVKQISSHDRLSFFGLMVKPVQRFPQFILFLQDLLKHTPQGHHDRMSLQLALTQLESLAEMLNERKREAEQYQAFKEMLRHISGKFAARPLSDCNRYLLREDNVLQLEHNQSGMITKAKSRRLLLLNDLVVCVAVQPKSTDDFASGSTNNSNNERLSLKWTCSVSDVEIQDSGPSPTLSRILAAATAVGGTGGSKGGSIKSNGSFDHHSATTSQQQPQNANNLCTEMSNLMHDYEILSRISDLVCSLKGTYEDITLNNTRKILHQIQSSIQQKDEEMAWVDSCCLQLNIKAKGKEDTITFKTDSPSVKKEWITELRLAQLALDPNNSPAWEVPEQEQRPSTKMPLFVKSQCVYRSQHQSEVRCGCYYSVIPPKSSARHHRNNSNQNYLWICTSDGASSHIAVLSQHPQQTGVLKDITSFSLVEIQVTAIEFVKGVNPPCPSLASDVVWMGTDRHRILIYAGDEPEKQEQVGSISVPDVVTQIKYHCDNVFVSLSNGTLHVYKRNMIEGSWKLDEPEIIQLGTEPVSSMLPINTHLYAACGKKVWVLNGITGEVQKNFSIQHEHVGNVNLMAHSGIGLWISLKHSSTICLYHTETFKHLQDINIASNVVRVTTSPSTSSSSSRDCVNNNRSQVNVTALLACKGLLWVGTNVGITLTIPLPRLEGVPIISGRVNISYHAHFGPITFLLGLQPKNGGSSYQTVKPTVTSTFKDDGVNKTSADNVENNLIEKQQSVRMAEKSSPTIDGSRLNKYFTTSSPIVTRRRHSSKESDLARLSKTLPRGFGNNTGSIFSTNSTTSSQGSGDTCDVYGLYGDLMYIKDYEHEENCLLIDPIYESHRRSDPELAALPNKVNTLDRRLKMKTSRPRSLDLSNWSIDSRSSSLCTSSGSEESMMALRHRNVSRNSPSASRQLNEMQVCENTLDMGGVNNSNIQNSNNVVEHHQSIKRPTHNNNNVNSNTITTKTLTKTNTVSDTNARRTIITLMGGRGYVNFRQPCCPADKSKGSFSIRESNRNDAHIVIWELRL